MDPQTRRVLLLERDAPFRQLLAEALAEVGFSVAACAGRTEALDLLVKDPDPDLLIVDLVDPAAGGEALLSFLRGLPETATIPAIVMTDGMEPSMAARNAVCLVKPFGVEELQAAAQEALGSPAPARGVGAGRDRHVEAGD